MLPATERIVPGGSPGLARAVGIRASDETARDEARAAAKQRPARRGSRRVGRDMSVAPEGGTRGNCRGGSDIFRPATPNSLLPGGGFLDRRLTARVAES